MALDLPDAPMVVVCPHINVEPDTYPALERCGLPVVYHWLGKGDEEYYRLMEGLWRRSKDVIIVDHDIVPHPGALQELADRRHRWCGFLYPFLGGLHNGLGCAKSSGRLMERWPSVIEDTQKDHDAVHPTRHWCNLDDRITRQTARARVVQARTRASRGAPEARQDGSRMHRSGLARLNLGCGEFQPPGWINLDLARNDQVKPDVIATALALPVMDASMEAVYAGHVLEHLTLYGEVPLALAEIRRVLRTTGSLMVVGPDIDRTDDPEVLIGIGDGARSRDSNPKPCG